MTPQEALKLKARARLRLRQQQSAAPAPIVEATPPEAGTSLGGLLSQAGAGLAKGAIGMAEFPAVAGQWLGEKATSGIDSLMGVPSEQTAQRQSQVRELLAGQTLNPANLRSNIESVTGPFREPQNTPEKYVDTISQFAATAPIGGPANIGAKLLAALSGGAASETAGQVTHDNAPELEPYARLLGGLAGGIAPSALRRVITPLPISQERSRLVEALRNEGVDLTAGQVTGRHGLRYAESELGGGSAHNMMETQGEQFTRAALSRAGINADRATPEVMDHAFTRIGNQFQSLAARNHLPPDAQLATDVAGVVTDYANLVPAAARAPIVQNLANDLVTAAQHGMPGDAYNSITSRLARMARNNRDPQLAEALRDMRQAVDEAMERHLTSTRSPDLTAWREARNQYRNMIVLEQAATGAGERAAEGIISPSQLRNATVQKQGRRSYARGQGDFAELARAGEATMKPLPQSGTAPRTAVRNAGQSLTAILGAMLGSGGGPAGIAAGGVAGAALPSVIGKAIMSRPGRAYLGNQLLGQSGLTPIQRALLATLGSQGQIQNAGQR